jgi:pimeloyl-ACP methyl ester carboxylesterase
MTILFAATYPERTAATVLFGTTATYVRADDYQWAPTRDEYLRFIEERERGAAALKGVPREWQLCSVDSDAET